MKTKVLKTLNPILAVLILTQAMSVILHDFLPGDVFKIIHKSCGVGLIIGIFLHLALNWNWVKANYLKRGV